MPYLFNTKEWPNKEIEAQQIQNILKKANSKMADTKHIYRKLH